MSASITRITLRKQLAAMGCECFEIGILQQSGRMLIRDGWNADQVEAAINWLRRENARGAHIFVRPHGAHAVSLIDDLSADAIAKMKLDGFHPAIVVETSAENFQAWVNHGRILDRALSTQAAKELARRFGGDLSSGDWRHFGRLAGFTNQKQRRRLPNGLAPFVRLREATEFVYSAAEEFLEHVSALMAKDQIKLEANRQLQSHFDENSMRPLTDFHSAVRYGGDLHRADMAWAVHAAGRGLSDRDIREQILRARDLSKKGPPVRQFRYAERTASKAIGITRCSPDQVRHEWHKGTEPS